jgi:hypothetical protein
MDIQEMMHRLLATINANQAKADADRKADQEDQEQMNANNKRMLAEIMEKMDANQAKADADRKTDKEPILAEKKADRKAYREETRAETEAIQARTEAMREERMKANMDACMADIKDNREETMACQETMEVRLEEGPASEDMTPEVAREQKVPVEDAVVMRRDQRHLATQRRQKKEEKLTEMVETTHQECEEPTSADIKVCHGATEARVEGEEEPASEEMKLEVAHEEVPREDTAVMPVRGLRKQRRGRKQAAGRREEPKKLNRGICKSQEKLAAACRKVSRRATVAWRRRNILRKILTHGFCGLRKEVTAAGVRITRCAGHRRKGQTRSTVERANQRVGWLRKKLQSRHENGNATKDLGGKWPLYPEKRKTTGIDIGGWSSGQLSPLGRRGPTYKTLKKTLELQFAKQADEMSSGLQTSKHWTVWRGRPPQNKRRNSIRVRVAR